MEEDELLLLEAPLTLGSEVARVVVMVGMTVWPELEEYSSWLKRKPTELLATVLVSL